MQKEIDQSGRPYRFYKIQKQPPLQLDYSKMPDLEISTNLQKVNITSSLIGDCAIYLQGLD